VPVPYSATVNPDAFEVSCVGLQLALPSPTFRACPSCPTPPALSSSGAALLSCDDLELVMAEDGLWISFGGVALDLCPGCFLVGGPNNIMAAWQTIDGGDTSMFPIAPSAFPYCGRDPRVLRNNSGESSYQPDILSGGHRRDLLTRKRNKVTRVSALPTTHPAVTPAPPLPPLPHLHGAPADTVIPGPPHRQTD